MPIYQVKFNFPIESLNSSLQVGDTIYYVPTPPNPTPYDVGSLSNVQEYGVLTAITDITIGFKLTIDSSFASPITSITEITTPGGAGFKLTIDSSLTSPITNNYLMFAKEKKINTTSLLGYYADIKFINNSRDKAELFSVGSEITESSK